MKQNYTNKHINTIQRIHLPLKITNFANIRQA